MLCLLIFTGVRSLYTRLFSTFPFSPDFIIYLLFTYAYLNIHTYEIRKTLNSF